MKKFKNFMNESLNDVLNLKDGEYIIIKTNNNIIEYEKIVYLEKDEDKIGGYYLIDENNEREIYLFKFYDKLINNGYLGLISKKDEKIIKYVTNRIDYYKYVKNLVKSHKYNI